MRSRSNERKLNKDILWTQHCSKRIPWVPWRCSLHPFRGPPCLSSSSAGSCSPKAPPYPAISKNERRQSFINLNDRTVTKVFFLSAQFSLFSDNYWLKQASKAAKSKQLTRVWCQMINNPSDVNATKCSKNSNWSSPAYLPLIWRLGDGVDAFTKLEDETERVLNMERSDVSAVHGPSQLTKC